VGCDIDKFPLRLFFSFQLSICCFKLAGSFLDRALQFGIPSDDHQGNSNRNSPYDCWHNSAQVSLLLYQEHSVRCKRLWQSEM
jgi:hypothetical protein